MRAWAVTVLVAFLCGLAATGCVTADLEGHACPCLEGYQCVNAVCVTPEDAKGLCPLRFARADACTEPPPASATLVAVCDDGASLPDDLFTELGAGAGQCPGGPSRATLSGDTLTGSLRYAVDGDDATLDLTLSGTSVWTFDVPTGCQILGGCFPSENSGSCGTAAEGCQCTGVELSHASAELDAFNGSYTGSGAVYFGCNQGGVFALREEGGVGDGPILLFAAE